MALKKYKIQGKVIESKTKKGLYNCQVEAWDKDVKYDDLVGSATTNDKGEFSISFDSSYFRERFPETSLDLFFKVCRGDKLLKSTEDDPILNAGELVEITIEVSLPSARPAKKDLVEASALDILKTADFFRQSDFGCVYNEVRSSFKNLLLKQIPRMAVNSFLDPDKKPIKCADIRSEDILDEDRNRVEDRLREEGIEFTTLQYSGLRLNRTGLNRLSKVPSRLKAGQRLNLYVENDKVRFYSLTRPGETESERPTDISAISVPQMDELRDALTTTEKTIGEKDIQIGAIRKELAGAKKTIDKKDEQIAKMQEELQALRKGQEEINKVLQSEQFAKFMAELQKPEEPKKTTRRRKTPPKE